MNYKFYSIISILFSLQLLFSCSNDDHWVDYQIEKSANLADFSLVNYRTIEVDSTTDWKTLNVQSHYFGDTLIIISLDLVNNDLVFHNYHSGIQFHRISFNNEGPNSMKGKITGYHFFSKDSLILIDNTGYMYRSNFWGDINNVINLDPEGIPGVPLNKPNLSQVVQTKNSLLLDNYYITNEGRLMKIIVTDQNRVEYFHQVPEEYIKGFWGIGDFVYHNYTFDSETKNFVYNFPNLDSVYIWNQDFTKLNKVDASSRFISKTIAPILTFGVMPSEKTISQEPLKRHIYSQLFYNGINYFRILGLPLSQFEIDLNDPVQSQIRKYAVIVFDKQLNWIGEYNLPFNRYFMTPDAIFVNEFGLHFQNKSGNENEATFEIWNIKNLNNE